MSARIGTDDSHLFESPCPRLLREVSGLEPEELGAHVLLEPVRVRSVQRLALGDVGGGVVAGMWPAELKPQAEYLYEDGRAAALIAVARAHGWSVEARPHLGFFTSPPSRRLYLDPRVDVDEYVRRWQTSDLRLVGQYVPDDVRPVLWPWLKQRAYASDEDDSTLEDFLAIAGRRPTHLRPGLRLLRRWDAATVRKLPSSNALLAATIRISVNEILRAAGEPTLPGT